MFGCGNKDLLNSGGLAVIGSRNASDPDLAFTDQIGAKAASENIAIISGGARGVDETVMIGAMRRGGMVVGVMADRLLRAATSSKWRKGLMEGYVVLVSPFYPEAGFNVGNAMARNKYIYCLADSSLVIHSGKKGGTLSGAQENLKKAWVPLWIKQTTDKNAANADLVAKGGNWLKANIQAFTITDLVSSKENLVNQVSEPIGDLFSTYAQPGLFTETEFKPTLTSGLEEGVNEAKADRTVVELQAKIEANSKETTESNNIQLEPVDFYQLFSSELQRLAENPTTVDELIESTKLHKSQLTEWLKRAVNDEIVKKLNRPVRYQVKNS